MAYEDNSNDTGASAATGADTMQPAAEDQKSDIRREVGTLAPERAELVKQKTDAMKRRRKFWKADFERMRNDQNFLIGLQYKGQTSIDEEEKYIANIVQRHVQQRTAAIYAKNPTVVARRKESLDFVIWDENPLTAQMAMQLVAQTGQTVAAAQGGDPNAQASVVQGLQSPQMQQELMVAQALLKDIQTGMLRRASSTRISRTMELYFKNKVLTQQFPPFKSSMKQLVRRGMAAGVGYVKLGLVRDMDLSPDILKGIASAQEQMATINRMMADLIDGDEKIDELSAEREDLRLTLEGLHKRQLTPLQEGIIFDFPSSTSIIPDEKMTLLQGFVGCDEVAEEFMLTPDQVKEIWKVDVSTGCTTYDPENPNLIEASSSVASGTGEDGKEKKGMVCIWIIYNRKTGLTYTVCDGYKDFLEEPCAPKLQLERFWPWFPLAFNILEHFKQRFPLSDVHLLKSMQREHNRSREGLRQHRIANRPCTVIAAGVLADDKDKEKLEQRPDNAVIQLNALQPGQKISDLLQTLDHPKIDPSVYETNHVFDDILKVVGSQEANLGGTSSKSTATESSIAESSRMSSLQSNMDDMDDFLTELMRAAGQAALLEIGVDEILRVVGPGAVWPELSKADIADEIFLEIQAGSSGRPNRAVEIQNFTQVVPLLLQIPGINPEWLGKQLLTRLDDRLDLTDAFLAGQPSIQTLNALAAKPLGQAPAAGGQDPNAQGPQGNSNTQAPGGTPGAAVPATANAGAPAPVSSAPVPVGGS